MGFNPHLDKLILNNYNELCDKIDQELIDFQSKVAQMIKDLEPENIELLINMGLEKIVTVDLKEHIDKYCKK